MTLEATLRQTHAADSFERLLVPAIYEKERRFAALDADSVEVLARFAQAGGFGANTLTNVAIAYAPGSSGHDR